MSTRGLLTDTPHPTWSRSSSSAAETPAASFLNTFSKVSEFVTHDHMLHYFKHNLNPIQHGFLKTKTTTTTLVTYLYFTSPLVLNIKYSIYFDLNGAFDLVSHPILLHKLCMHRLWQLHELVPLLPYQSAIFCTHFSHLVITFQSSLRRLTRICFRASTF